MASQSSAFVGLGNLGLPMVARLVDQGWHVEAHDVDRGRVQQAVEAGATPAYRLDDLAGADIICLAVPDGGAVTAVLLEQGLLDRLTSQSVVVVSSTILPGEAVALAQACADRGVAFLDAPVSGGAARARTGDLTVMVGATGEDLERGRSVLEALASEVVHVGAAGAGSAVKLANQLMLFSALAGAYEAMDLARAYGVDEDRVLTAVGSGTGSSWASAHWGFYDELSAEYDRTAVPDAGRPWRKDMREVVRAGADAGIVTPLAALLGDVLPPAVRSHADRASGPPAGSAGPTASTSASRSAREEVRS